MYKYCTSGVPYEQVSTAQLGVACLLGLGLLTVPTRDMWQETVIHTCRLGGIFGLEKLLLFPLEISSLSQTMLTLGSTLDCRPYRWLQSMLGWLGPIFRRF